MRPRKKKRIHKQTRRAADPIPSWLLMIFLKTQKELAALTDRVGGIERATRRTYRDIQRQIEELIRRERP